MKLSDCIELQKKFVINNIEWEKTLCGLRERKNYPKIWEELINYWTNKHSQIITRSSSVCYPFLCMSVTEQKYRE